MNAIFSNSSQFGSPYSSATIGGIINEVYRTSSTNNRMSREFNNRINNANATFSLHSASIDTSTNTLKEKIPDPYGAVDLLYKNDNSGFGSANTGFFIGFKQGSINYKDFEITNGLPNLVLDINSDNVGNGEVWVQTVDEAGQIQKTWNLSLIHI